MSLHMLLVGSICKQHCCTRVAGWRAGKQCRHADKQVRARHQPVDIYTTLPCSFCKCTMSLHVLPIGSIRKQHSLMTNSWDQQTWDAIMAVNYTGAISLAEQILPVLAEGAPACSLLYVW